MFPTVHTDPLSCADDTARPSARLSRWLVLATAASLCATGLALVTSAPAGAAPTVPTAPTAPSAPSVPAKPVISGKPRLPVASTPKVSAVPAGLAITGWAFDPNAAAANLRVAAVIDGVKTLGAVTTSLPNKTVTTKYRSGPTPGYALQVAVPTGKHVVCVVLDNLGGGQRVVKRCVTTPLGRVLTSSQVAKRSPRGAVQAARTTRSTVRVTGWASDPDLVSRRSSVVVYLNGQVAARRVTTAFAGVRPTGAGRSSFFDISVPATRATQIACVWVVNVGFGRNTFLGCNALDTRATGATTAAPALPATPAINKSVIALAKKQIGKPYVWGATGPRSFDCSGLVMWAYGKYRYQTPRVSQDQIKAARLIPASRAVPGDLVFYHDTVGDVYHVGIFLKPGLSVAAISTDQGVDYQRIWDPTATYGSFTHV